MPALTKEKAVNVLSAWTALEVLSPLSFRKAEELIFGTKQNLIHVTSPHLPWHNKNNLPKEGEKIFYEIIVGTINLEKTFAHLLHKYSDSNPDRKKNKSKSLIASILVNHDGTLLSEKVSVSVSSFAWGIPKTLSGELKDLANWPQTEFSLLQDFDQFLHRSKPVDLPLLTEAYEYLLNILKLPRELTNEEFFIIQTKEKSDKKEPPTSLILNSFYLKDLAKAADFFSTKTPAITNFFRKFFNKIFSRNKQESAKNLELYLGTKSPQKRYDVLNDEKILKTTVSPQLTPSACWPAPHHNPLVLLQQAAVNLALNKIANGGILAVNGPPGTGKTTLLRDIVSGIITKRAEVMCDFSDPESAFIDSGNKVKLGQGFFSQSKLDTRLKGFEILIASSNNKAVENVSSELPTLKVISSDASDLRYFKILSDTLLAGDSWGIIAAVLGNSSNCYKFTQDFWWNKDCSINTYLAEICGTPQIFEERDKNGKIICRRKPKILSENSPPRNREEALRNWLQARDDFKNILKITEEKISSLPEISVTDQLLTPYGSSEIQLLREKVFISAIKLHKAFIDAAARPLRQNLGIFINSLSSRDRPMPSADLWSSFFLTVPCISTTFASLNRLFDQLPDENLGWLLIDEAGQATPQAAVGAMMKSKRAIVVGDPMQIEPVVTLPNALTEAICENFSVDANSFNAPSASVQSLCDKASSYFAEFHGRNGNRQVGVPLLVHRRCEDPMFSISNAIAYENLMVSAKNSAPSKIRNELGPSAWFDVSSSESDEKYSPAEGRKLVELLRKIKCDTPPDLYIITPFVSVAEGLHKILRESKILESWNIPNPNSWLFERVGTVHTAQGREAEAVFFVLGASAENQRGARIWAGIKPNLLNVAVTRAKEVFYVIGNKDSWREAALFQELLDRI